jgi:hypothetical protein
MRHRRRMFYCRVAHGWRMMFFGCRMRGLSAVVAPTDAGISSLHQWISLISAVTGLSHFWWEDSVLTGKSHVEAEP